MGKLKDAIMSKVAKVTAGGLGAILAAVGGFTSISALQPAVDKATDYAARGISMYCELPQIDRAEFRRRVAEQLRDSGNAVTVTCAGDR